MFVSAEALEEFTGKKRSSAQARFLRERFPGILLIERDDGTIALRQEEFDRHTLSKPAKAEPRRRVLDLSYLSRAG